MTPVTSLAGTALIERMVLAGCDPLGVDAIQFAVDNRPIELAVSRAEYWFSLVGIEPPSVEDLIAGLLVCGDCAAYREAEQNPSVQCDPCGWANS